MAGEEFVMTCDPDTTFADVGRRLVKMHDIPNAGRGGEWLKFASTSSSKAFNPQMTLRQCAEKDSDTLSVSMVVYPWFRKYLQVSNAYHLRDHFDKTPTVALKNKNLEFERFEEWHGPDTSDFFVHFRYNNAYQTEREGCLAFLDSFREYLKDAGFSTRICLVNGKTQRAHCSDSTATDGDMLDQIWKR
jgi:hypothetical protein